MTREELEVLVDFINRLIQPASRAEIMTIQGIIQRAMAEKQES